MTWKGITIKKETAQLKSYLSIPMLSPLSIFIHSPTHLYIYILKMTFISETKSAYTL